MRGYGRKRYKADFIKFLVYSHASNLETIYHLEKLKNLYSGLSGKIKSSQMECDLLGGKLYSFLRYLKITGTNLNNLSVVGYQLWVVGELELIEI